jgi:hypothetical protein
MNPECYHSTCNAFACRNTGQNSVPHPKTKQGQKILCPRFVLSLNDYGLPTLREGVDTGVDDGLETAGAGVLVLVLGRETEPELPEEDEPEEPLPHVLPLPEEDEPELPLPHVLPEDPELLPSEELPELPELPLLPQLKVTLRGFSSGSSTGGAGFFAGCSTAVTGFSTAGAGLLT